MTRLSIRKTVIEAGRRELDERHDHVGAASALAVIPMARGVTDLLGSPGRMPLLTDAVTVGGVALAAASGLLVTKVIEFPPQEVAGAGYAACLLL